MFTYAQKPEVKAKMVPVIPDYLNDVANGTLPQVAMIEGGYQSGKDEHPAEGAPGGSVQVAGPARVRTAPVRQVPGPECWRGPRARVPVGATPPALAAFPGPNRIRFSRNRSTAAGTLGMFAASETR